MSTAERVGHIDEVYHNKHVGRVTLVLQVDETSPMTVEQLAKWLHNQPVSLVTNAAGDLLLTTHPTKVKR